MFIRTVLILTVLPLQMAIKIYTNICVHPSSKLEVLNEPHHSNYICQLFINISLFLQYHPFSQLYQLLLINLNQRCISNQARSFGLYIDRQLLKVPQYDK